MNLPPNSPVTFERTDFPLDLTCSGGWFIEEHGRVEGPFSDEDFHKKMAMKEVTPETLCWRLGFDHWIRLGVLIKGFPHQGNEPQNNMAAFPTDTFPLAVLLVLIVCFTVFFVVDSKKDTNFAAKVQSSLPQRNSADSLLTLNVCNETKHNKIYAAVAYFDPKSQDWVTRGWYPQKKGECTVALKNLTPPIYGFAETKSGRFKWKDSSHFSFCINGKNAFVNQQTDCLKNADSARLQNFELLEIQEGKQVIDWRIR